MTDPIHIKNKRVPDHHFHTQFPNIILELKLEPYEFMLYCYLRKVAGDAGACWKKIKTISEELGISERKIQSTLSSLAEFKGLINESLICIERRQKEDGSYDTNVITLNDIWPQNGDYYRNKAEGGGGAQYAPGVVHNMREGGAQYAPKEEPMNKIPSLEGSLTPKSPLPADEVIPEKSIAPLQAKKGSVGSRKFEVSEADLAKWGFTHEQRESFFILCDLGINTDQKNLSWWAKNHTHQRLMDVYRFAKKECPDNMGPYMYSILKKDSVVPSGHEEENKEAAEKYREEHKWNSLQIKQRYVSCLIGNTSEDVSFLLDPLAFLSQLFTLHERKKMYG